jgi:glycosyltransferase involved in cell wall biosynthesis
MRIGLLAPPWVPVPPPRYGGSEQVIDDLARGLVALGHEVVLFSLGESTCPVPRRWLYERGSLPIGTTVTEFAHVVAGYRELAGVDVVHDHTVLGALVAARTPGAPPVVVTNHGPFNAETTPIYRELARTAAVVAISASQRATAPDVPVSAVVPHGVDLQRYTAGPGGGGYLLFVGRMSPDKGLDHAIAVARRTGRPLRVLCKMWEADEVDYFHRVIEPLLCDDVEILQEQPLQERIRLVQCADALVNPICWPEPFGLVMAEALACGTPVLAFPRGAATEIVEHGRTGFLCGDVDEMAAAVGQLDRLDRADCRRAAVARFDMHRMAADYARLYDTVLGQEPPRARPAALLAGAEPPSW